MARAQARDKGSDQVDLATEMCLMLTVHAQMEDAFFPTTDATELGLEDLGGLDARSEALQVKAGEREEGDADADEDEEDEDDEDEDEDDEDEDDEDEDDDEDDSEDDDKPAR